tara:strand:+ start:522 stop:851 length:330 start_codon:yes stop_codon:yes gene_type:complete
MEFLGNLKDFFTLVWGVSYIIIATIALFGTLNIFFLWFFTNSMLKGLLGRVNQLDSTIAEAIKAVIGEGISQVQEINPVQLMIMDLIKGGMKQKVPDLDKLRDNDGKFT